MQFSELDSLAGIALNLEKTKGWLKQLYPNFKNLRVVNSGLTYEQAQQNVAIYADQNICKIVPSNEKIFSGIFSLYSFDI